MGLAAVSGYVYVLGLLLHRQKLWDPFILSSSRTCLSFHIICKTALARGSETSGHHVQELQFDSLKSKVMISSMSAFVA